MTNYLADEAICDGSDRIKIDRVQDASDRVYCAEKMKT